MRCVPIKHALLSLSLFRACESLHFKIGLGCGLFLLPFPQTRTMQRKPKSWERVGNNKKLRPMTYLGYVIMRFNYVCTKCDMVVQSDIQPNSGRCPNRSAGHFWENLGEVGPVRWQCSHCGLTVNSKNQPNALICKETGRYHDWRRM